MDQNHKVAEFQKLQEVLSRNPFAVNIGMELLETAQGYVRTRIRLRPQLENIYGSMHGGCAFSLS